jgi:hypothetical protein
MQTSTDRKNISFNSRIVHLAIVAIAILAILTIGYRDQIHFLLFDRSPAPKIVVYDAISDDAFYYMEIAKNIIAGLGSTFDEITQTNGYHPLWMLILVILGLVVKVDSLDFAVILLLLVNLFLVLGTYVFHRLQGEILGRKDQFYTAAIIFYFAALFIARSGMEVCLLFLVIPLFLLQLIRIERRPSLPAFVALGFLASILVLSRLDAVLFAAVVLSLYAGMILSSREKLPTPKQLGAFAMGGVLFPIYLLYNLLNFDHVMPISGRVKALHFSGLFFSQRGWESLVEAITTEPYLLAFFLLTIAGLGILSVQIWKRFTIKEVVLLAPLIYPVLFFAYYLLSSDWPFWLWYFYPLAVSSSFGYIFIENQMLGASPFLSRLYRHSTTVLAIGLLLLAGMKFSTIPDRFVPNPILEAATWVQEFSSEHPGIYAMGDRAGAVSILLDEPLIQLEGLVADNELVNSIQEHRDLLDVLNDYSVDYYIATNPEYRAGCWEFQEPQISGTSAPRMRGSLCEDPVFTFVATLDDVTTMIFKISP